MPSELPGHFAGTPVPRGSTRSQVTSRSDGGSARHVRDYKARHLGLHPAAFRGEWNCGLIGPHTDNPFLTCLWFFAA